MKREATRNHRQAAGTARPRRARLGRTMWLLPVALTAIFGCAAVFQQPQVELVGMRLAGLGLAGGTVLVELSVENPNAYALDASGLTYDVDLLSPDGGNWFGLADGTFDDAVRVEAGDTAAVEIPVEFSYSGLGSALRSLMDYGTVEYRIQGRIAVRAPVRREVPYRHAGTVTIP